MAKEVKKINLGSVLSWIFGILFLLVGIGGVAGGSYIIGILIILCSAMIIPYFNKMVAEKFHFEISRRIKFVLVIIIFILLGFAPSQSPEVKSGNSDVISQPIEEAQTGVKVLNETQQPEQKESQSTLTKSPKDLLPTREDVPTEFKTGSVRNITINATGFESGNIIDFHKLEGTYGLIEVEFKIWKFSSVEDAKTFYSNKVNKIKEAGGYTKLKSNVKAECFAYKEEYGFVAKFGENFCIKENVIFSIYITTANTFERVDSYVNDMAKIWKVDELYHLY